MCNLHIIQHRLNVSGWPNCAPAGATVCADPHGSHHLHPRFKSPVSTSQSRHVTVKACLFRAEFPRLGQFNDDVIRIIEEYIPFLPRLWPGH
jgi:hypothetical protein